MSSFRQLTLATLTILLHLGIIKTYAQQTPMQLGDAKVISYNKGSKLPDFIQFNPGSSVPDEQFGTWAAKAFNLPPAITFKVYNTEKDELGFTTTRYREYVNSIPIEGTMLITHSKNGRLINVNGDYYLSLNTSQSASISEKTALVFALKKVNAKKYKWENKAEQAAMGKLYKQDGFSYYPKGELVIVHKKGAEYTSAQIRLAYKFNIYAEEPLYRANVFVDAQTGEILDEKSLICTADVLGSTVTKYSGTVPMTCDNFAAGQFRLQETGRGSGIQTYNLNATTNYTNTDFTNSTANWSSAGNDQCAEDAHWSAEMTYDYYKTIHNRNSIDNAGLALLSYVHYSTLLVNAFWNGTCMSYGDGDASQGYLQMTALDICGHEITHGLTQYTSQLNGGGTDEASALNEANSDIFGTTIEFFARPLQHDWLMGADVMTNHAGLRDMSNPKSLGQPDCYLGTNWDPNGECHNNDGPYNYWYYLLCQGGNGTNDIGSVWTVSGISMNKAKLIAYRGNTVYFTPTTAYADARTYTIQAAVDLYGECSPEVMATTNAWYAVGVGPAYSAIATASFTANVTSACNVPFTVNFTNTSNGVNNALWNFGDGTSSSSYNASHTYTSAGTFNVKLAVNSACGKDSTLKTSYITLNPPAIPTTLSASSCSSPASLALSATGSGTLDWYTNATGGTPVNVGNTYTTPVLTTTTIYYVENQVPGATVNVGPVNEVFGTGGYHNNTSTQYLIFDVGKACTLQTVYVNSGAAGSRNVTLWDSSGAVLQNLPVNFPNGIGTVTLNMHLNPGKSFRLGGTGMNLYRNNTGAAYPYPSSVINITGSSAGAGFYYYFYNWQVQDDPCISGRTAVIASIGSLIVTYSSPNTDSICQSASPVILSGGTPAGGTYSGPGVSSGSFDPKTSGLGNQVISYTYNNGTCSGTATHTIVVSKCPTGISNSVDPVTALLLYPNPTNRNFTLELGLMQNEKAELKITNTLGQVIQLKNYELVQGNNKLSVSLNDEMPRGIYFVRILTSSNVWTKSIDLN